MKKKIYTRPVSVTLTDEMFEQITTITDHVDIGFSEYIRKAIREKLQKTDKKTIEQGGSENE